MDLQIKVFRWPNHANHIIMFARGTVDIDGFTEIFRKLTEMSVSLHDCKILIDLLSAKCALETADVDAVFERLPWEHFSRNSRVAMVFARANKQYGRVAEISATLSKRGFKVAVFEDSELAANWLVNA
jgi:hypothetical protein